MQKVKIIDQKAINTRWVITEKVKEWHVRPGYYFWEG